ncbi:hypothetical protein ACJZ2D_015951 [Fusarium nematophilum]
MGKPSIKWDRNWLASSAGVERFGAMSSIACLVQTVDTAASNASFRNILDQGEEDYLMLQLQRSTDQFDLRSVSVSPLADSHSDFTELPTRDIGPDSPTLPFSWSDSRPATEPVQVHAKDIFHSLHGHVAGMFREIEHLQARGFLGSTVVVLLVQSMAIHQLRMESVDPIVRVEAGHLFVKCRQALWRTRQEHAARGYSTGYLDSVAETSADQTFFYHTPSMLPYVDNDLESKTMDG